MKSDFFQKMKALSIFVLFLSLEESSFGAEADNFTHRLGEIANLPDSLVPLDEYVNSRLKSVVEEINQQGSCKNRALYLGVWNALGRNPIGEAEKFAESDPSVKSYLVDFKVGIYGGVPTFWNEHQTPKSADLFILSGWFSASIRLNGHVIGIDKLGHFFGQGWEYFHSGNMQNALNLGLAAEKGLDGFIGSGVFSFADLSANADGLLFWKQLLGSARPYVKCHDGKFIVNRAFTWKEYVSGSWDEAQNCSDYGSASMFTAITHRTQKSGLSCPVSQQACVEMVQRPCSNFTVHPSCFAAAGVHIEQKTQECQQQALNESWAEANATGVTSIDHAKIKVDTLLGILGMSLHYSARKARAAKK